MTVEVWPEYLLDSQWASLWVRGDETFDAEDELHDATARKEQRDV